MALSLNWLSIPSKDPKARAAFLKAAFGWNAEVDKKMPGPFIANEITKGVGADISPIQNGMTQLMPSVHAGSIDKSLPKALAAGAKLVAPKFSMGPMGNLAIIVDPEGQTWGLWEPAPKAKKAPAAKASKAAKKPAPKKAPAKKAAKKK